MVEVWPKKLTTFRCPFFSWIFRGDTKPSQTYITFRQHFLSVRVYTNIETMRFSGQAFPIEHRRQNLGASGGAVEYQGIIAMLYWIQDLSLACLRHVYMIC